MSCSLLLSLRTFLHVLDPDHNYVLSDNKKNVMLLTPEPKNFLTN